MGDQRLVGVRSQRCALHLDHQLKCLSRFASGVQVSADPLVGPLGVAIPLSPPTRADFDRCKVGTLLSGSRDNAPGSIFTCRLWPGTWCTSSSCEGLLCSGAMTSKEVGGCGASLLNHLNAHALRTGHRHPSSIGAGAKPPNDRGHATYHRCHQLEWRKWTRFESEAARPSNKTKSSDNDHASTPMHDALRKFAAAIL